MSAPPEFFDAISNERFAFGGWAVMARACRFYGDDSGAHGSGVFIIGGYLATDENWSAISKAWKTALDEAPKVENFHMGSNYHGQKQFEGWDESARQSKRDRMLTALEPYTQGLVELSSSISWDDYRSLDDRFREAFPNPYLFCFHGIVSLVKDWLAPRCAETGEEVHVSYTFDRESALEARIQDHFFRARTRFPQFAPYLGGLCFEDDKYLPGLQVADVIAWLLRRDLVKPSQDNGIVRPELTYLRSIYKHDTQMRIWPKDRLAKFWERTEAKLSSLTPEDLQQ